MNLSDNVSNATPVWGYAMVKPKEAEESDEMLKRASQAGIQLLKTTVHTAVMSQITAKLIRFGGNCFEDMKGRKPVEGEQVLINKFAGFAMSDALHRLIDDTDIVAVVEDKLIVPLWGNVLIKCDDITETDEVLSRAKQAGLCVVDKERDHLQRGQIAGEVIAFGGNAFETWKGCIPSVGDRVIFSKGAGFVMDDGVSRLIADTDIKAIL